MPLIGLVSSWSTNWLSLSSSWSLSSLLLLFLLLLRKHFRTTYNSCTCFQNGSLYWDNYPLNTNDSGKSFSDHMHDSFMQHSHQYHHLNIPVLMETQYWVWWRSIWVFRAVVPAAGVISILCMIYTYSVRQQEVCKDKHFTSSGSDIENNNNTRVHATSARRYFENQCIKSISFLDLYLFSLRYDVVI